MVRLPILEYAVVCDAQASIETVEAVFVYPHEVKQNYFDCPQGPMLNDISILCLSYYLVISDVDDQTIDRHNKNVFHDTLYMAWRLIVLSTS